MHSVDTGLRARQLVVRSPSTCCVKAMQPAHAGMAERVLFLQLVMELTLSAERGGSVTQRGYGSEKGISHGLMRLDSSETKGGLRWTSNQRRSGIPGSSVPNQHGILCHTSKGSQVGKSLTVYRYGEDGHRAASPSSRSGVSREH